MKRFAVVFALGIVLLLGASVLADSVSVSGDTEDFVKDIASKRGVAEEDIQSINQIDFNDLPEEVNIQNIDETNLALYQVNVEGDKSIYIITASETEFKKELQNFAGKMLLNLGLSGETSESAFLESSAGVKGSEEQGYVMIRDGSVTGISTSLKVKTSEEGVAEIIIYKNGEVVGFRNTFDLSESGAKSDYDTVGDNIINFNKGDTISVKVIVPNGAVIEDINTLVEITSRE